MVRYDSMLATALALDAYDAGGCVAQWRQLVDLVVQANGSLSDEVRVFAFEKIAELRSAVPVEQRRLAAMQLASRVHDRDGVAVFGTDEPVVAAPILSSANLDSASWNWLIPQIPPASRALLRNRRDLPEEAVRALASYGPADFALPPGEPHKTEGGTQIRDLVARIEAFRLGSTSPVGSAAEVAQEADVFAFETDFDGVFDWVLGAPREALIGVSLAEIASAGGYGVDGQAAGAFRRRAPFRDARLLVAGAYGSGGDWLISATPIFNPRDGRFAGYHGSARRPRRDEFAGPVARFAGTALPVDSLRQLIHELRTPLNAILGFAEMIDRQLLGPVTTSYREQARAIVRDGQRLVDMVDDLDHAARARRDAALESPDTVSDVTAVLERVQAGFQQTLAMRKTGLTVECSQSVEVFGVSASVLERIIVRLIGAVLGLAQEGENVTVTLSEAASGHALLSIARPSAVANVGDAVLLDPAYDPETPYPDAPLLGLGFTLRLIGKLARDVGGSLVIGADAFVLNFPGARVRADLPA